MVHGIVLRQKMLAGLLGLGLSLCNASGPLADDDFFELSLQELSEITVTSVSKREQRLAQSAAAVFVITQEDIQRSGATHIPDLLRMVPGVQVAQMSANAWAISVRGFNREFSNKLLVMIDGRTVYTPLFSGVFWDVQDTLLADIERIEVIRGPGGALWGANAVNGVINIITRAAAETQGTHVAVGGGNQERAFAEARYGGALRNGGHWRLYGKWLQRDETEVAAGQSGAGGDMNDDWDSSRVGFRSDWQAGARNAFTVQGDAYQVREDIVRFLDVLSPPFSSALTDETEADGTNLLGRWTRTDRTGAKLSVQAYYDYIERRNAVLGQDRHTLDLDLQHHLAERNGHQLSWGLGYRLIKDDLDEFAINGITYLEYEPDDRVDNLYSAFVQDQISLAQGLQLTLGSKFEHNNYTDFEFQPNARIAWDRGARGTWWAAVSRAVRTPTRGEHGLDLVAGVAPPGFVGLLPNEEGFESEVLVAYELGFRNQSEAGVQYDLTLFYNDYDELRSFEPMAPTGIFSLPFQVDNKAEAEAFGLELFGTWQVTDQWRLSPAYSYLKLRVTPDSDSGDSLGELDETNYPEQQFSLRSYWSLSPRWRLDSALHYVDELARIDSRDNAIPDYWRLDARLSWQPRKGNELSLVAQNILDGHHPEFGPVLSGRRAEIPRSLYAKWTLTWD